MAHSIPREPVQSPRVTEQALDWGASDWDPIIGLMRDYSSYRALREALMDDRLQADDPEKLDCVLTMIDANMLLARHRLEHTPPVSKEGVAILLRYALSITNDPNVAAVLKSCLTAVVGVVQAGDGIDMGEAGDEAFDDIVTLSLDG